MTVRSRNSVCKVIQENHVWTGKRNVRTDASDKGCRNSPVQLLLRIHLPAFVPGSNVTWKNKTETNLLTLFPTHVYIYRLPISLIVVDYEEYALPGGFFDAVFELACNFGNIWSHRRGDRSGSREERGNAFRRRSRGGDVRFGGLFHWFHSRLLVAPTGLTFSRSGRSGRNRSTGIRWYCIPGIRSLVIVLVAG